MKGIINAEWLATNVAGLIYRNGKAKMFNFLESQLETETRSVRRPGFSTSITEDTPKMKAVKRITEDLLETISKQAAQLIRDTLGDWQEELKETEVEHAKADTVAAGLCERVDRAFKSVIK